jgi:hypothetical protein
MAEFQTARCDCDALIIWAIHERTHKRHPVDAEPTPAGDLALTKQHNETVTYRVLKPEARFGRKDLRTSHFATCPNADQHRTRGRAAR